MDTHVLPTVVPSELMYRLLVEGAKDYAIFLLAPDGTIASWNTGAERIKGYKAEEIIGRHFSLLYPPDVRAEGAPARELEAALALGRVEDEGWRLRKDGTHFWANVIITPLRDQGEILVGFSKITRDLTDRKRAQEALQEAKAQAEDALAHVRILTGLLPICSYCKRIRDDAAFWHEVDEYIGSHTDVQFSHGICPACFHRVCQPQIDALRAPRQS